MTYVRTDTPGLPEYALAIGAPGSIARLQVEYPNMINNMRVSRSQGLSREDAIKRIPLHFTIMETNNLIQIVYEQNTTLHS